MQFKLIAAVTSLLLFSSPGSSSPIDYEPSETLICDADNALRALRRFSSEAIPFCRSYIGLPLETVTVGTVTPTVTITVTLSIQSPIIDKRAAETLIARDSNAVFGLAAAIVERDFVGVPTFVSQYPMERISSACSCLTIPLDTRSVTATAPAYVTTVTETMSADLRPKCKTTYNTSGSGSGNIVDVAAAINGKECCRACHAKDNCVASAFVDGKCRHLVNTVNVGGDTVSGRCPLGVKNYHFGPASPGLVFAGPCGV